MNNGRDPYAGLIREMQRHGAEHAPPEMCLGVVTAVGDHLLHIRTEHGLELSREDLVVNASLAWDAEEELTMIQPAEEESGATLAVNRAVQCYIMFTHIDPIQIHSITLYDVPGVLTGTVRVKTRRLQAGDTVLLQPAADGQIYYVLCKVVRP